MRISHQFKGQNVGREIDSSLPIAFLLPNKAGGMLYFDARKDKTQYYTNIKGKTVKVLHDINASGNVVGVSHKLHSIAITRKEDEHELFVPHYLNGLVIKSNAQNPLQLVLELKHVKDSDKKEHSVEQKQGRVIIRSTSEAGEIYTAIQGDNLAYEHSKENTEGNSRILLDILSTKMSLAVADNENDAIMLTNHIFTNEQKIKEIQEKYSASSRKFNDPEAELAYACALNCIDHAIMPANSPGQSPFFSEVTGHHKAIASHAFLLEGEFKAVKKMLLDEVELQSKRLMQGTASFEEAAWPMLLLGRMLNNLCASGKLYNYFSKEELKETAIKIVEIAELAEQAHVEKSMSEPAKLESEALMLSIYDLAFALTKAEKFGEAEKKLREEAKAHILGDIAEVQLRGHAKKEDVKSVFLAAYTYPLMLSKEGWKETFDTLLGMMHDSFDTLQSKMLKDTGEETLKLDLFGLKSLAAIVLARTDAERYEKRVNEIMRDSISNVLYKGVVGRPSSSFVQDADPETEAIIEDAHVLNNALFLEMLRECS
jgi:hypothetical protein